MWWVAILKERRLNTLSFDLVKKINIYNNDSKNKLARVCDKYVPETQNCKFN